MKLIDFFADWRGNGIFAHMGSWVPWYYDNSIEPHSLDWQYFGNRSGWRNPSPLLMKILPPYQVLDAAQIDAIVTILKSMYEQKWSRLWSAMNLSYSLTNDIDVTERHTGSRGDSMTETAKGNTKTHTDSNTSNRIVPFGVSSGTYTEISNTDTDVDTESTEAYNNGERNVDTTKTEDLTIRKFGKMPNVIMSKRVEEEINLRKNTFFDIIMSDIDDVLTIPFWG